MTDSLFDPNEIIDLIACVGQKVEFCKEPRATGGLYEYAVPPQKSTVGDRTVSAYVVPEQMLEIALGGDKKRMVDTGDWTAFVAASDVPPDAFEDPASRIRFKGKLHQIQLVYTHVDRGIPRLYEIRLK